MRSAEPPREPALHQVRLDRHRDLPERRALLRDAGLRAHHQPGQRARGGGRVRRRGRGAATAATAAECDRRAIERLRDAACAMARRDDVDVSPVPLGPSSDTGSPSPPSSPASSPARRARRRPIPTLDASRSASVTARRAATQPASSGSRSRTERAAELHGAAATAAIGFTYSTEVPARPSTSGRGVASTAGARPSRPCCKVAVLESTAAPPAGMLRCAACCRRQGEVRDGEVSDPGVLHGAGRQGAAQGRRVWAQEGDRAGGQERRRQDRGDLLGVRRARHLPHHGSARQHRGRGAQPRRRARRVRSGSARHR